MALEHGGKTGKYTLNGTSLYTVTQNCNVNISVRFVIRTVCNIHLGTRLVSTYSNKISLNSVNKLKDMNKHSKKKRGVKINQSIYQ